jgi:tRNA pseudouridine13 synthase
LTLEQMGKARLTGTRRMGRLLFPDLEIQARERGLELSFSLSKGAFATTVLREVMKIDDNALATLPADDSD